MKPLKYMLLLITTVSAPVSAQDFIHFNAGRIQQTLAFDITATNGVSTVTINETDKESDSIFGFGYSKLTDRLYLSTDIYLLNTDSDTYYLIEVAPHLVINNMIYLGVTAGYQKYESTDLESANSIGTSKSQLEFNGFTAGISMGLLFFNGALDINLKSRFENGSSDSITGTLLGFNYTADLRVERTTQVTIGYNYEF